MEELQRKVTNIDELKFAIAQASHYIEETLQRNPEKDSWFSAFQNFLMGLQGNIESALEFGEISEEETDRLQGEVVSIGKQANDFHKMYSDQEVPENVKEELLKSLQELNLK